MKWSGWGGCLTETLQKEYKFEVVRLERCLTETLLREYKF